MNKMIICKWIVILSLFFSIISISLPTDAAQTIAQGIDISMWQGTVDFEEVKKDGVSIVYIRAGYGENTEDSCFENNYQKAKKAELEIGFYYYVTAENKEEAVTQAHFFAQLMDGKEYTCRPAMDFETYGSLSKTQINEIALTFLTELQKSTKVVPMVYSDSYATETIWEESLKEYPLWVADYSASSTKVKTGIWDNWSGFQYTDMGSENGITTKVDKDHFRSEIFIMNQESDSQQKDVNVDSDEKNDIYFQKDDNLEKKDNLIYRVCKGDTLWKIAIRFHTSVDRLVQQNQISNPDYIWIGEKILIPENQSTNLSDSELIYTVRWMDTLSEIADRFDTTVQQIVQENEIENENLIYIGQKLIINN